MVRLLTQISVLETFEPSAYDPCSRAKLVPVDLEVLDAAANAPTYGYLCSPLQRQAHLGIGRVRRSTLRCRTKSVMTGRPAIGIAVAAGALAVGNGLFMLYDPANWYFAVPGVTATGPFNQHFIRDIGFTFVLVGLAYVVGAFKPAPRSMLWGTATLWLTGHALFHGWEVAVGICGPADMARDFPAVTLPALLGAFLTAWSIRDRRSRFAASPRRDLLP